MGDLFRDSMADIQWVKGQKNVGGELHIKKTAFKRELTMKIRFLVYRHKQNTTLF